MPPFGRVTNKETFYMDEQTTTEQVAEETGAEVAQPVETEETTAVETTEETQVSEEVQEPETEASTNEPSDEDELSSWAANKGVKLESENDRKLAQMARESEKAFHRQSQKKSELQKTLERGIDQEAEANGFTDQERITLAKVSTKLTVREFFDENPDAREYEAQMAQAVTERPYLANDLEALYALAKVSDTGRENNLKQEGAKNALSSLAQKQRTATPSGAAVQSVGAAPTVTRAEIARRTQSGDIAWLNKHQSEIDQKVATGTLQ